MTKHKVFYSFHYEPDNWRVGQVRNIGVLEGNAPVHDNDWEAVKQGGDAAIEKWIDNQMQGRSCVVVLIGSGTANRKWITYEIVKAWNDGKGVVGIHIHGLENNNKETSAKGKNPFSCISRELSSVVKCYDPVGSNSKEKYAWIEKHLNNVVQEAKNIRKEN